MQDAKGRKCAKGVITIEDDETVKMMNKICDEGSAIENILGDDEPEKRRCKRRKRWKRWKSVKSAKGVVTIEDDEMVKIMNKIAKGAKGVITIEDVRQSR